MPLSPADARPGAALADYLAGWRAIETLVHRGGSWSGRERKCAYLNAGGGRFAGVSSAIGWDFDDDGRALAVVDWDFDGDLDIWVSNRTGPRLRLLRNESNLAATGNRFVAFKLQGATCNRDAVGARVEVHLSGRPRLVQTVYAGDAFLSQSSKWLHFGLGRDPRIEKVSVRWPGGKTETFTGVQANRRYTLTQGSGQAVEWTAPSRALNLVASPQKPPRPTGTARVVLPDPYPMPRLTFQSLAADPAVSSESPSGPLLINLWASWCQPCLAELKELAGEERKLRAAGLDILALSVDGIGKDQSTGPADARRELDRIKFPFRAGRAAIEWLEKIEMLSNRLFDRHLELVVPTSFLVDRRGDLFAIYRGAVPVATVLSDLNHLDTPPPERRNLAGPFPGRWYSKPGRPLLELMAADYGERFPDEAVHLLKIALRQSAASLNPASPSSQRRVTQEQVKMNLDLARLLAYLGKMEEASSALQAAAQADPGNVEPLLSLAEVQRSEGKFKEAVEYYRRALAMEPGLHEIADRLAWVLATHPDPSVRNGEDAVRVALRACDATGRKDPNLLQTLAAAYAEAGRYPEALVAARLSIELARPVGSAERVERFEARLRMFEQGRPVRTSGPEPARE